MKVVLRFVAGLNKLNCFSIEEIANNVFQTLSTREGSRYLISCDAAVNVHLVQWLFETQSDYVIEHVLGQKTIEFELSSGMVAIVLLPSGLLYTPRVTYSSVTESMTPRSSKSEGKPLNISCT